MYIGRTNVFKSYKEFSDINISLSGIIFQENKRLMQNKNSYAKYMRWEERPPLKSALMDSSQWEIARPFDKAIYDVPFGKFPEDF